MNKAVPQYRVVYETLRKLIENGDYNEGDILPSENDLCKVHNVTRPTVRKALDMLTNEGFITRHQGLGSLVLNKPKGIGILSISGITSAVGQDNLETVLMKKPNIQPWPKNFPYELTELEQNVGCIHFERLRKLNNEPVFYDITYLPNFNLPRFANRNLNNKSLFAILREHYQIQITGGEQNFQAGHASETIQKHLNISAQAPVLYLERKLDTSRHDFHLYSFLYCNTEKHKLFGQF